MPIVLKSGSLNLLEPPGPVQACNGIALEASWNVMAHAQKPDFVFRRSGRVHLNRWERQFSRLLAAEVCASAVVMMDTPCSEVMWRVLATHSIRQIPLHFPSCALPCAITFQLESTFLCQKCKSWPYQGALNKSLIGGFNNCAQGFLFPSYSTILL